jgi:hypothetical protein
LLAAPAQAAIGDPGPDDTTGVYLYDRKADFSAVSLQSGERVSKFEDGMMVVGFGIAGNVAKMKSLRR